MSHILRRNAVLVTLTVLAAGALGSSVLFGSGGLFGSPVAYTGCGYGYSSETGYAYQPGYGTCPSGGGGGGGGTSSSTTSSSTTTTTANDEMKVLAGKDRIETSIITSQDTFVNNGSLSAAAAAPFTKLQAKSVTLARSDIYPDALSGTPLAVKSVSPLLLTNSASLDSRVENEIKRVIGSTGTVHLLGGTAALSPAVESRLKTLGYTVVRHAGVNRYETAVAVANALGNPKTVLEATGINFPDALAAGAAAAKAGGSVLLTVGSSQAPATAAYLKSHTVTTRYAIGGPATRADTTATKVAGVNRYDTAAKVASTFFTAPTAVGLASGQNFPDALSGGDHIGFRGGPLLLTPTASLATETANYLKAHKDTIDTGYVYGGTAAVSLQARSQFQQAYSGDTTP